VDIKERIQHKAGELFMRYGIRSITMDEIAAQLGVSKKTIYQSYADKDALVMDVFLFIMHHNKASIEAGIVKSENAIHEQFLCSDTVQEMFANMNPAILFDMQRYHPVVFKEFENYKKNYVHAMIKSNIQRGIAEGLYRAELDVQLISWLVLECNFLCMHSEDVQSGKHNMSYIDTQLTDFTLHALATTKGLKLIEKYTKQRTKQ